MQILAIDIGTGTQDILLFDSETAPENCLKLVMPSPTLLVSRQVREATAARRPLLITGRIMGGGPSAWAVADHRRAGLRVLATADAARTFNDDLEAVQRALGVAIVGEEAAAGLAADPAYAHVRFGDFDYHSIRAAFAAFGVPLQPDALALAVFDHGAAPPGVSDRQFRMDYLAHELGAARPLDDDRPPAAGPRLSAFAARASAVPPIMTRLAALADVAAAQTGRPVVVMDTAPAAVLGALDDPAVAAQPDALVVNVGNFHCLAFQFRNRQIVRLFEHHTGELSPAKLAHWLRTLAEGSISHEAIFADHGHGAICLDHDPIPLDFIAVTGPRRALAAQAGLPVHFAVPHGDQMLSGCFGLVRACADLEPTWRPAIRAALAGQTDRSLW